MFDKTAAAKIINEAASTIENDVEMYATQQLATYIAATETGVLEDRNRMGDAAIRNVYAEIALAWQAGFEEGVLRRASGMGKAIKAAGLQV